MDKGTILLENKKTELLSLKVEHGLSLLIETENKKFLFDCGASRTAIDNALLMNETLRDVDTVILSHSHYDHAAGARPFIKQFHPQRLIVGKGFFQPKYAREKGIFTYLGCGFDQSFVKQENVNLVECNTTLALTSHLSIIGGFERYPEFDEPIPERFVIENEQGQFIKDTFKDEIALVYSQIPAQVVTRISKKNIYSLYYKLLELTCYF